MDVGRKIAQMSLMISDVFKWLYPPAWWDSTDTDSISNLISCLPRLRVRNPPSNHHQMKSPFALRQQLIFSYSYSPLTPLCIRYQGDFWHSSRPVSSEFGWAVESGYHLLKWSLIHCLFSSQDIYDLGHRVHMFWVEFGRWTRCQEMANTTQCLWIS